MKLVDVLERAYLEGYQRALSDYAWWKDGREYVGRGVSDLSEARKRALIDVPEYFKEFLEKQKSQDYVPKEVESGTD